MELTANTAQAVNAGANVLFTDQPISGNCSIMHRPGSGLITLRGLTRQCRARYRVFFTANVAAPTDLTTFYPLVFALAINGEEIAATRAVSTPTEAEVLQNIATMTIIDVPQGCCTQLSVKNVSTGTAIVSNSNIVIERIA